MNPMHLPRLIARGKQEDMGTSCGQEQGTVYAHCDFPGGFLFDGCDVSSF